MVFLIISQIEMGEKLIFFTLRPVTQKRKEILEWAVKGEKPGIHRRKNAFWSKIGCRAVLTVFWSP